jgi:hypothetical protein
MRQFAIQATGFGMILMQVLLYVRWDFDLFVGFFFLSNIVWLVCGVFLITKAKDLMK